MTKTEARDTVIRSLDKAIVKLQGCLTSTDTILCWSYGLGARVSAENGLQVVCVSDATAVKPDYANTFVNGCGERAVKRIRGEVAREQLNRTIASRQHFAALPLEQWGGE